MTPAALVRAVAAHIEAAELRVRKVDLRDADLAAVKLQFGAAQEKLAGLLGLMAWR